MHSCIKFLYFEMTMHDAEFEKGVPSSMNVLAFNAFGTDSSSVLTMTTLCN